MKCKAAGGPVIDLHLIGLFSSDNFMVGPDIIAAAAHTAANVGGGAPGVPISFEPNALSLHA